MAGNFFSSTGTLSGALPYLVDGLRVVIFGLALELARRYTTSVMTSVSKGLTVSVALSSDDETYVWVERWLADQCQTAGPSSAEKSPAGDGAQASSDSRAAPPARNPAVWQIIRDCLWPTGRLAPRHLYITNRPFQRYSPYRFFDDRSTGTKKDELGRPLLHIHPAAGSTVLFKFHGHVLKLETSGVEQDTTNPMSVKWITISCFLGSIELLETFLTTTYRAYLLQDQGKLRIMSPSSQARRGGEQWTRHAIKEPRPWESVVLPKGVKEDLLADCQAFLDDPWFYQERGIPFRRGYLLHGVPGAGKSSLVAALASKLGLDIHMLQLGDETLDDSTLTGLLAALPRRCILLLEDVDCAMPPRVRDTEETPLHDSVIPHVSGTEGVSTNGRDVPPHPGIKRPNDPLKTKITLSGLLNALDGVASSEGRLTFFTTNHPERIDPAMSRPGRCDVWLEFKNATREQARELFLRFNHIGGHSENASHRASHEKQGVSGDGPAAGAPALQCLGEQFSNAIPAETVSVSALQAYLLRYKRDPAGAVADVQRWVEGGCKQETLSVRESSR